MPDNTVNTSMLSWQEWQNRIYSSLAQQCPANYGAYTPSVFCGGSSGSSTTSTTNGYESTADYLKRMEEQNKPRTEYVTIDGSGGEPGQVNMTGSEKKACIENEKAAKNKEHALEHNLPTSLLFSSVFVAPAAYKTAKGGKFKIQVIKKQIGYNSNKRVTKLFYSLDKTTGKATYEALFKEAPTTMINAQDALMKASRQAKSALKHATSREEKQKIIEGYDYLKKLMKDALAKDTDEVAKVTEQIRAANKIPYKKLAKKSLIEGSAITKETLATQAAATDAVTKAKAIKGSSFKQHLGGKTGIIMGIAMAGLSLFMSKNDIEEAYKKDKETGRKQLWHSLGKAIIPVATFTGGDALGKWLTTKFISKGVTKLATKLVAKGAGKAIGAAIGSCVPGIGTAVGLALGCVLDWAISKYGPKLLAKIKGEDKDTAYNSPIENARIEAKTNEELFETIAIKKMQGQEKLTAMESGIIDKNKALYEAFVEQVQAQQAQQQQEVATA